MVTIDEEIIGNTKYCNSAGRVLAALVLAANERGDAKTGQVWSLVTGAPVGEEYRHEVYSRLQALNKELTEVERQVQESKGDKAIVYVRSFPKIREILNPPSMVDNWNAHKTKITPELLQTLEFCAVELDCEEEVKSDELEKIRDELNQLCDVISKSNLNSNLKRWLLQLLSDAKRSIDLYHIHGARSFRNTLKEFFGEAVLFQEAFKAIEKEDPDLGQTIAGFLVSLRDLASRAKEWQPLVEYTSVGVVKIIESLPLK